MRSSPQGHLFISTFIFFLNLLVNLLVNLPVNLLVNLLVNCLVARRFSPLQDAARCSFTRVQSHSSPPGRRCALLSSKVPLCVPLLRGAVVRSSPHGRSSAFLYQGAAVCFFLLLSSPQGHRCELLSSWRSCVALLGSQLGAPLPGRCRAPLLQATSHWHFWIVCHSCPNVHISRVTQLRNCATWAVFRKRRIGLM